MTTNELVAFLRERLPLFAGFALERLVSVVDASKVRSFEANEAVVHQGSEAAHFGVVLSGSAGSWLAGDGGRRVPIGKLEAPATFGEMALMTGDPSPADVIAETRCEVLLVPVTVLRTAIAAEPPAVARISRTIAERMKAVAADPERAAAAFRAGGDPYGLTLGGERPEKLLVVNFGSSSLKYACFDTADESRNARGAVERIGADGTKLKQTGPMGSIAKDLPRGGYAEACSAMLQALSAPDQGILAGAGGVSAVVHRVVHGGERYTQGTVVTDEVLAGIEQLSPLAPLHNPVNLAGIREMQKLFPAVPHIAVFDTAFHHTLPSYAYLYGLPYDLYEDKRVRRYGFHGSSHQYAALRAAQFLGRRPNALRVVSCHLGNGSSLCAVDHGRSVDTTMGFTPAEGLIMGTRAGDVDAGILAFLERTEGRTASASEEMLNRSSGLLGLSDISGDMREVQEAAGRGEARALLALKTFSYRVRKYIGAYVAAMGGLDAVVFTGGIGQGSAEVRALALQGLGFMGIALDDRRNREARGFDEVCRISADGSPTEVLVVPADEERMMAREAIRTLSRSFIARALEAQERQPFLVEVSAHHVHLTQEHVEALYGAGHHLTRRSDLSQPGQFACEEQVTLIGPKGSIERVRVLGPARTYTQVEIAMTEQFKLGVHPPIRESGDLAGTPGCTLEGPGGSVALDKGVICALRHVHMSPADALLYGVRDKSVVAVRIEGERPLVFGDVLIRVDPNYALAMHIDTDEANAAGVQTGARGSIASVQQ